MNSLFDAGDEPLSNEDLTAVRQNAAARLNLWRKRSGYSGATLLVSCLAAVPFTAGHALHALWEPLGMVLVCAAEGSFIAFVYCLLLLWVSWKMLRDLGKG